MSPAQQMLCSAITGHPILFRTFQSLQSGATDVVEVLSGTKARNEIGLDELLIIGHAKLFKVQDRARIERNLRANSEAAVRAASRAAFAAEDDQSAITNLITLNGVGVAVASAVLAWCLPDRWPVIDRHAWRTLTMFGVLRSRSDRAPFRVADYTEYCDAVRPIASQVDRSPQAIDTWLYSFARCGLSPADAIPATTP